MGSILPGKGGERKWDGWKRLVLIAYWIGTIVIAIVGWQTRLVRARRIRLRNVAVVPSTSISQSNVAQGKNGGIGGGVGVENKVGAEMATEERRVHASLNMRRKFFHALAVLMFVPGIAIDVSSILLCVRRGTDACMYDSPHLPPSLSPSHSPSSPSPNTLVISLSTPSVHLYTSSFPNSSIVKIVDRSFSVISTY